LVERGIVHSVPIVDVVSGQASEGEGRAGLPQQSAVPDDIGADILNHSDVGALGDMGWRAGIIFVIRNATDGAWAAHCEASDRGVSAKGRRSAHEINKIAGERRSRGRNGAGLHKRITRSTFRASRVFLDELEGRGSHAVEGESTAREGGCAAAIRRSVRGIELIGSGRKDGSAGRTVVKIIGINYAAGDAPTMCGDISDDGDIGH